MKRVLSPILLGTFAMAITGCGGGGGSSATTPVVPASGTWVAAWAVAPANAVVGTTNPASSEQTFREIVHPSVGSQGTIRLSFSNAFGTAPVTLGAVHIAVESNGAAIVAGSDVPVTFGGKTSATIPTGATLTSDALKFAFSYGTNLAVTEYVSGSWPALTQHNHPNSLVTSYETASGAGNATADTSGAAFAQTTPETFLLDRLDVLGSYKETVAVLGSSTTEGFGADPDGYDTWVDDIAKNLHTAGHDDIAVVNMAITPDSLLTANGVSNNQATVDRFSRDILSLPGVKFVIQNAADVDLKTATCSNAAAIIAGDQALIAQAHTAGLKIFLAKVAPTTYCNGQNPGGFGTRFPAGTGQDAERMALNAWMSSTQPSIVDGTTVNPPGADGVIDLSTPITDPTNTGYMLPAYDVGDDSHVNVAGQALQAAAVPISAF